MDMLTSEGFRQIGKPSNWDDEADGQCLTLHVLFAETEHSHPMMYSLFRPSEEDLKILNAGGAVRLGIMGNKHPVINMTTIDADILNDVGVEVVADMGAPIRND